LDDVQPSFSDSKDALSIKKKTTTVVDDNMLADANKQCIKIKIMHLSRYHTGS
jgi:hypothetical protein